MTEYEFHPPTFRRRWQLVTAAAGGNDHRFQQVKVECYPDGVRLVATDQYVLATAWVPAMVDQAADTPWDAEPEDWYTIAAHNRALGVLLDTEGTITLQRNVNDRSVTFSGGYGHPGSWSLTVPYDQTDIGEWRHLFTESPDHTDAIAIGQPIMAYFTKIAPLLQPDHLVVMRWYNRGGKVTPFQFSVEQHALRGLAMPINLP